MDEGVLKVLKECRDSGLAYKEYCKSLEQERRIYANLVRVCADTQQKSDCLEKVRILLDQLEKELDKLLYLRDVATFMFSYLDVWNRTIMTHYYIMGMTWVQVAMKFNMCERLAAKYRKESLDILEELYKKGTFDNVLKPIQEG